MAKKAFSADLMNLDEKICTAEHRIFKLAVLVLGEHSRIAAEKLNK